MIREWSESLTATFHQHSASRMKKRRIGADLRKQFDRGGVAQGQLPEGAGESEEGGGIGGTSTEPSSNRNALNDVHGGTVIDHGGAVVFDQQVPDPGNELAFSGQRQGALKSVRHLEPEAALRSGGDRDRIAEIDCLDDGDEIVKTIVTASEDLKREIKLGWRNSTERGGDHD